MPLPLEKPRPGAYRLEQKAKKAVLRTDESKHKRMSKARDGYRCRAPHATYQDYLDCMQLRLESGHVTHKGMGGDPSGERNAVGLLVTFGLRCHRERFDRGVLRVHFLTPYQANGPVAWLEPRGETWVCVHAERHIGDANDKWRRMR